MSFNLALIRVATTIQNRLSIACVLARTQIYDLGKNYTHSGNMRHGRLYFIWLCYMVISVKGVDLWSARLFLSPHSAQNPLDMENDWMYANSIGFGFTSSFGHNRTRMYARNQRRKRKTILRHRI